MSVVRLPYLTGSLFNERSYIIVLVTVSSPSRVIHRSSFSLGSLSPEQERSVLS